MRTVGLYVIILGFLLNSQDLCQEINDFSFFKKKKKKKPFRSYCFDYIFSTRVVCVCVCVCVSILALWRLLLLYLQYNKKYNYTYISGMSGL